MGCTEAKGVQAHPIDPQNYIKPNQINDNNRTGKFKNTSSEAETWEQFSQQQTAMQILLKQELSSKDLQFLISNLIWKQQWFIAACQMLQVDSNENKQYETQIMKLFLQVKLKQAKFLQNQSKLTILCEKCYKKQLQKFHIEQSKIDKSLFQVCKVCQGIGWIKSDSNQTPNNKTFNCSLCKTSMDFYRNETQCLKCNTLGFKWKK